MKSKHEEKFKDVLLSPPNAIMGKNGLSEDFAEHLKTLIKRKKIIKVKALKSAVFGKDIDKIAQKAAELTNSYLLDVRGKTFVLSKYPKD